MGGERAARSVGGGTEGGAQERSSSSGGARWAATGSRKLTSSTLAGPRQRLRKMLVARKRTRRVGRSERALVSQTTPRGEQWGVVAPGQVIGSSTTRIGRTESDKFNPSSNLLRRQRCRSNAGGGGGGGGGGPSARGCNAADADRH